MNNSEKKLLSLINATQVITSSLDVTTVIERLIEEVLHVIDGADAGVLFMHTPETNRLTARQAIGYDLEHLKKIHLSAEEGMTGKVFHQKEAMIFSSQDDVAKNMLDLFPQYTENYTKAVGALRYPQCAVCAPLLDKQNHCIGVFTIVNFSGTTKFTQTDLQLLQTFANQSMIAIENARLFTQNERTNRIYQSLALQDDLQAMTHTLADLLNEPIFIINEFLDIVAMSSPMATAVLKKLQQDASQLFTQAFSGNERLTTTIVLEDVYHLHLCPIRSNITTIGILIVVTQPHRSIDPLDLIAIQQASMIFAVQLTGQEKTLENQFKYDGYLLQQVLEGFTTHFASHREVQRCNKFIAVVIELPVDAQNVDQQERFTRLLYRFFQHTHPTPLINAVGTHYDVLFMAPNTLALADFTQTVKTLLLQLYEAVSLPFIAGIGRPFEQIPAITASHRDAKRCIEYLHSTHDTKTILTYDELGVYRLFLNMPTQELHEYIALILGPIITYDMQHNTDLLATLEQFIHCNQNQAKTASACFVHVNTIKYRLNTIYQLMGKTVLTSTDLFEIQLALQMKAFTSPS